MRLKPANSLNQVKARRLRALAASPADRYSRRETFKSTDSAEGADVADMNLTFLHSDGEFWHFMNNTTFEQLAADEKAVGDNAKWLLDQALNAS